MALPLVRNGPPLPSESHITGACDLSHIPSHIARLDCAVVAVSGLEAPEEQVMRVMKIIIVAAVLAILSAVALGQAAPAQSTPAVKHVPITNAPSTSGKEMFKSYCAVCHGVDGKGNGPAASAMKTTPADLTALAQKDAGNTPPLTWPRSFMARP